MALISKNEIARLAAVQDAFCISIFIPTHRAGAAVLQKKDPLVLKNQLKEVREKLKEQGLNPVEVEQKTEPVQTLLEDSTFWSHQSDGLALFLSDGFFEKYTLPVRFEAFNYVGNGLYLKPLMPLFTGDGRFFILTLNLKAVQFYEGTRHTITDVHISDLTPSRLEEVVGFDFKEKNLQLRTQHQGTGGAIYHGHGDGKDDQKTEIEKYFRAVNKGLMTMLHDESPPMVVACQDHIFALYKSVNSYKYLLEEHLSCNPADLDKILLHEKAWMLVQPHFEREKNEKIALFRQFRETDRTATDIKEIVPAALNGRVDALFLENRTDIYGIYNPAKNEVVVQNNDQLSSVPLMNLAAIQVFQNGGEVYLLEDEAMPAPHSKINALYRY